MTQNSDWGDLPEATIAKVKTAIAQGVRQGLSDPETFRPLIEEATNPDNLDKLVGGFYHAFQRHAKEAAGDAVMSGVKGVISKAAWFVVGGILLYSTFGWTALVGAWKILWFSKGGA